MAFGGLFHLPFPAFFLCVSPQMRQELASVMQQKKTDVGRYQKFLYTCSKVIFHFIYINKNAHIYWLLSSTLRPLRAFLVSHLCMVMHFEEGFRFKFQKAKTDYKYCTLNWYCCKLPAINNIKNRISYNNRIRIVTLKTTLGGEDKYDILHIISARSPSVVMN